MPIEVGAIVHWACIDFRHAESLVKDIEINRDVAMHRGGAPGPDVSIEANRERHTGEPFNAQAVPFGQAGMWQGFRRQ